MEIIRSEEEKENQNPKIPKKIILKRYTLNPIRELTYFDFT